jgi:hypothetical protein
MDPKKIESPDPQNSSSGKDLLKLVGLVGGCLLFAWLMMKLLQ